MIDAVEDYFFIDPAGFETTGYLGSASDASQVEVREGARIDAALRADDGSIRRAMAALALSIVAVEETAVALDDTGRLEVFGASATQAMSANDLIIDARAALGDAEARIETAIVANSAESAFLQAGRTAIIARDPFEAATEFTALETRLQSIFAITSRLSSLTLTSFLR
ncbi:MAG: flagellin [Pseudomonadota bacterium]